MSEQQDTPEYNYQPPSNAPVNVDIGALIQAEVSRRLSQMGVTAPERARELSPEEAARAAVDNKGAGLGVEERFAEIYRHLDTVLKKVGI